MVIDLPTSLPILFLPFSLAGEEEPEELVEVSGSFFAMVDIALKKEGEFIEIPGMSE
jgi:hypothetical protein